MLHATWADRDGRHAELSDKILKTCIDKLRGNKQLKATIKKECFFIVSVNYGVSVSAQAFNIADGKNNSASERLGVFVEKMKYIAHLNEKSSDRDGDSSAKRLLRFKFKYYMYQSVKCAKRK